MSVLRKESSFRGAERELNTALMGFQGNVSDATDALARAMTTRLRPQEAVTEAGYKARPGLLLPVTEATTVLLTKPTPDFAGQPLAIWNGSGGVVLLDPIDCTLNGADVGWIGPGLHLLYPDATDWFGGNTRAVELHPDLGALTGNATGAALSLPAAASAPAGGTNRLLVVAYAQQGVDGVGPSTFGVASGQNHLNSRGANLFTTVRIDVMTAAEHLSRSTGSVQVAANGTSLLGLLLWLTGVDQNFATALAISTDSTTTTVSADVTTTRPGAMILDFMANDDATDTGTPGADQTELVDGTAGSATVSLQASYRPCPRPGTYTMSWSALTNAANKAHIAIVIEPAEGV